MPPLSPLAQWLGVTLLALASALPGLAAFTSGGNGNASERGLTRRDMLVGSGIMLVVATTSGAPPPRRDVCSGACILRAWCALRCVQGQRVRATSAAMRFPILSIVRTRACAGLAGVLTERLLKTAPGSTHFKNMQLYAAGVALYAPAVWTTFGAVSAAAPAAALSPAGLLARLLAGWTPLTALLVLNLAFQGLAVSWLLRLASNIEKLFAGAAALFASMALSAPLFGYVPCAADVAGGALVCVALTVYHWRELRA
jgi:hypothetical protein